MELLNSNMDDVVQVIEKRKIVFFGCGSWLSAIEGTQLMKLKKNFAYIIDNGMQQKYNLNSVELLVYPPQKVKEEEDCVIILTSPIYMYDMYQQLEDMKLGNNITCYAFPFIEMVSPKYIDPLLYNKVKNKDNAMKIPKIIHSFWFSGENKPDSYQNCVDSWKRQLGEYEIIEWNKDNYNWHKHPFLERAIELGAWAFAADYARLDVLNEFGGIYLDMDVEVFKEFDDLLGNDALLSFSNNAFIDLAVIGSRKCNPLLSKMLKLYDEVDIPHESKEFSKFFQPAFVRSVLLNEGIRMDGSLQRVENATIFPNDFFMPLDNIIFKKFERTEDTYCVHYDNFGWSFSKEGKREKKIRDNNILWNLIEEKKK